jgi:hypothetical protein
MPELTDAELDERLSELERDLGPTLRAAYRRRAMRAGFAAQVRATMVQNDSVTRRRPALRVIHQRVWATLAATLVGVVIVGSAAFINRPQPVSAADVLDQLQAEAFGVAADAPGPCPGPGAAGSASGTLMVQSGGPGTGPVTVSGPSNANELSERLAKALGVSGERVREAMLATVRADMARVPPEPMTSIAQQLGKTPAEVCAAFFDSHAPGDFAIGTTTSMASPGRPGPQSEAVLSLGGDVINVNSATADQLREPAQRLGVSPERLLAAVRAALPSTPPPPAPNADDVIKRLASNLGMSEDKVRAAIKQVQGKGPFYFAVPLPVLGR